MNYQVPQHIDDNRIFIVQRSEIEGRLDAQYYKMSIHIPNSVKLSSFASVKGGKRIPKGYSYSEEQTPYYYLRVADMDNDNELSLESLKFIDEEVFNKLKRYEIKKNELAISIAGTIGKICYLSGIPEGCRVVLTENCAKIVISDENVLNAKYLEILFKMPFIQKQLERNYIQTTIPKLGLDKITTLNFPQIPTLEFQKKVVEYYNSAYKQKLKYESDAHQLLNSIDAYILNELGITLPEIKTDLKSRMFLVNRSELEERLDPEYKLYVNEDYKSKIYDSLSLGRIATICKGSALSSKSVVPGNIPVIAGGQSSPYSHNQHNFNGNVITISASGAYAGYVWYHERPIFASDCSVVYSKNEDKFSTRYIFEVLKALQPIIYRLQVGAAQPHVYPADLMNLYIPYIPLSLQQEIVNHIDSIRQQAKQLQEEGKAILENAKKEVEQMIIG